MKYLPHNTRRGRYCTSFITNIVHIFNDIFGVFTLVYCIPKLHDDIIGW